MWLPKPHALQRSLDKLSAMDATAAALSVDNEATTQNLDRKHGLRFPVGHNANANAIADATGAFVDDDPVHLLSIGFVPGPAGQIVGSVYSSGAIGRLVRGDIIGLVRGAGPDRRRLRAPVPGHARAGRHAHRRPRHWTGPSCASRRRHVRRIRLDRTPTTPADQPLLIASGN